MDGPDAISLATFNVTAPKMFRVFRGKEVHHVAGRLMSSNVFGRYVGIHGHADHFADMAVADSGDDETGSELVVPGLGMLHIHIPLSINPSCYTTLSSMTSGRCKI